MVLHDFHMATRRQKDIYQLIRGGEYICHSLSTIMEANARLLSRHENFMWGLIHVRYKIHRPQYIEVTSLQPAKSHALPKRKSFFKNRKIYPQPIWLHKLYMFEVEKAIPLIPTLFFFYQGQIWTSVIPWGISLSQEIWLRISGPTWKLKGQQITILDLHENIPINQPRPQRIVPFSELHSYLIRNLINSHSSSSSS